MFVPESSGRLHIASNRLCMNQEYDRLVRMKGPKKVLVALSTANAAARQKLRGIYRYVTEGHDWDVQLVRSAGELTVGTIREAERNGIDGYILSIPETHSVLGAIAHVTTPVVAVEIDFHAFASRREGILHLRTDNAGIGRAAAAHLTKLGHFRSFAFIPDEQNRYWSQARGAAFCEFLSAANAEVRSFEPPRQGADFARSLSTFLDALPKPVGVFAAWDYVAAQTLSTCRELGLSVPEQVSIIGVDDDEFVCESVKPSLSTILVDREKQGHDAAVALEALMRGRRQPQAPVCRVVRVVERESTAPLSPSGSLVERALRFIDRNVRQRLQPDDVARHLGVSRRLLDLRFAELASTTLAGAIRNRKLKEVERLLKTTSLSDTRIAAACGFANVNALRNLFRATRGRTMREFHASPAV